VDILERYGHAGFSFGGADFTIPGADTHYAPDLELEPRHLDIALQFDIPACAAVGSVVTTVMANSAGARRIVLQAYDFEGVAVRDADDRVLAHSYDGRKLEVVWEDGFELGETRNLVVDYRLDHPVSGLLFSSPDEQYPDRAHWVASDNETERARYWLPVIDYPAVRTTLTFHLTSKADHTILANGLLTEETENADGTRTAHWHLDFPCPSYLICLVAGELVGFTDQPYEGRPLAYFGARGRATEADLERSFGRTGEIMEWLEGRLGVDFPFKKYYQFALPRFGGAMENISLVSWDDLFIADEALHGEFGDVIDIVNVHEMAHSYFGDAVVIRDFAHAWLKESWATYIETCWHEDKHGTEAARYDFFADARAYMDEADKSYVRPIVTRVFNSSWDMYDRHLYPGGACRLHMLRQLLGDEVFWPAVTEYLTTYSGQVVETEDFRRIMERRSGRSLCRFFDQWIYGRGYPKVKARFTHDKEKGQGSFVLEQTQVKVDEKHPEKSIAAFAFPLSIAWETPSGEWIRRDVEIDQARHTFLFPMAEAPAQIRIDPDAGMLFRLDFNPGDDMLRTAVGKCPDVIGRIFAAEELAKTGKAMNIAAVVEAFRAESVWGARRAMVVAVAKTKGAAALSALIEMMESEDDPRVLATLAQHAGGYRDPRMAAALLSLLERRGEYFVRSYAYDALGKQRGDEHVKRLQAGAETEDYRGLVRSGALRGLGATRTETASGILFTRIGYGREREDSAGAAIESLAACADHLERRIRDRAIETITDQLRDPRDRVRGAAVRALARLKATGSIPAIEGAMKLLPEQEQPRVRRALMGMSGDGKGKTDAATLKKTVEKLEDRLRKVVERLDKIDAEEQSKSEGES
jgi:aminopeptidase N